MIFIAITGGILFFVVMLMLINIFNKRIKIADRMKGYLPVEENEQYDFFGKRSRLQSSAVMLIIRDIAKILNKLRKAEKLDKVMQYAGLPLLGNEFITIVFCLAVFTGIIVFLLTLQGKMAVIGFAAMILLSYIYIRIKIARRLQAFTNQCGDALLIISDSMRAGFSFTQAMDFVSKEMDAPLGEEFARVIAETHIGVSIEYALQSMAQRVRSNDFDLVVAAVIIQRQVGGNLAYILDNISNTINSRIRMKNEVKTLTAQGRMSGWILAVLPIALGTLLYFINPRYIEPLFTEPLGQMALLGGGVMELIGIIVIQKIVDIDV